MRVDSHPTAGDLDHSAVRRQILFSAVGTAGQRNVHYSVGT